MTTAQQFVPIVGATYFRNGTRRQNGNVTLNLIRFHAIKIVRVDRSVVDAEIVSGPDPDYPPGRPIQVLVCELTDMYFKCVDPV